MDGLNFPIQRKLLVGTNRAKCGSAHSQKLASERFRLHSTKRLLGNVRGSLTRTFNFDDFCRLKAFTLCFCRLTYAMLRWGLCHDINGALKALPCVEMNVCVCGSVTFGKLPNSNRPCRRCGPRAPLALDYTLSALHPLAR